MLTEKSAIELAAMTGAGEVSPVEVVQAHLERIAVLDRRVGAFEKLCEADALAEAEALAGRSDLADLPLAGVPLGIKDNLAVAGQAPGHGTPGTSPPPSVADHEVVARLRGAGAIVVGRTRMPQLGVWGSSDCSCGIARNPWNLERTAGGSSGGSAAAVASGMVPAAVGNDGLGSIRIPSACCGAFGIKPGEGLVESGLGPTNWMGMAENGPITTTVADAALMLSVMAGKPELAEAPERTERCRVAVSTKSPVAGVRIDATVKSAVAEAAWVLGRAGYTIRSVDPPYSIATANAVLAYWTAAVAEEVESLGSPPLEPRTARHAAVGRMVRRRGWAKPEQREIWKERVGEFFAGHDVLVTPALATPPPKAGPWSKRSWSANILSNAMYAPFAAPWNFSGYAGASVPMGIHPKGTPIGVQIVAPPGSEALVIQVAAELERTRPWQRHAPL